MAGGNVASVVVGPDAIAPYVWGNEGADRLFIGGRSGCGKSVLTRSLASVYRWSDEHPKRYRALLVFFDPNSQVNWPKARIARSPAELRPSAQNPVWVYRPRWDLRQAEHWNFAMGKLFLAKEPVMLVVEDGYALEPLFNLRRIPGGNMLTAYQTMGRARHKGMIFQAQRPVAIPKNVIGQANRYVMFDMPHQGDRQQMVGVLGEVGIDNSPIIRRDQLGSYQFWYADTYTVLYPVRMRVDCESGKVSHGPADTRRRVVTYA